MQVLRPVRSHSRSQTGRHHDGCERRGHEGVVMAGAGGFEPPVTGPKPAALPLGYAPSLRRRVSSRRGRGSWGDQGFPHVENPLPYRLATPHRCREGFRGTAWLDATVTRGVATGSIEQQDGKEEETEQ